VGYVIFVAGDFLLSFSLLASRSLSLARANRKYHKISNENSVNIKVYHFFVFIFTVATF